MYAVEILSSILVPTLVFLSTCELISLMWITISWIPKLVVSRRSSKLAARSCLVSTD